MIKRIAQIAPLGGEPVTQRRAVPHDNQPREMLEHAPAADQQTITDYDRLVRQSEAFGDIGLKVSLEITSRTSPWNLQRSLAGLEVSGGRRGPAESLDDGRSRILSRRPEAIAFALDAASLNTLREALADKRNGKADAGIVGGRNDELIDSAPEERLWCWWLCSET